MDQEVAAAPVGLPAHLSAVLSRAVEFVRWARLFLARFRLVASN